MSLRRSSQVAENVEANKNGFDTNMSVALQKLLTIPIGVPPKVGEYVVDIESLNYRTMSYKSSTTNKSFKFEISLNVKYWYGGTDMLTVKFKIPDPSADTITAEVVPEDSASKQFKLSDYAKKWLKRKSPPKVVFRKKTDAKKLYAAVVSALVEYYG
jgi:hypothetical protein